MTEILTGKPQAGVGGPGGGFGDGDFGDHGGGLPPGASRRAYRTGMWLALLAISMVFIGFTSAYIVRSGLSDDWQPTEIPSLLWWNALVLILSSFTIERTRQGLNTGRRDECNRWLAITTVLGITFLVGQALAWRQLASHGVYVTTNPSSSFFYLLTATHGLHLLGGVAALLYIGWEAWHYRLGPAKRTLVEVTAIYWHFMDGLWIYILLLLSLWR
ncbi:MAG: heme-copper oxidase subunit III [Acidobacteria bacterium]|nr:heme-copper oxidase subunit III [Acidobacteriota bacterium]